MSVVTIKPITQAGVPQPRHRFDDTDLSVVMANRPSAFGASGLPVAAPGGGGGATVLTDVAVVGNTATLEAITNEAEGFIAYNDQTFQLWVSSGQTTASVTIYTKQNSGPE